MNNQDTRHIKKILEDPEVISLRKQIIEHDAFKNIKTQNDLTIYMEHHIFQVWDFMIILKAIQFWMNNIYKEWYTNFSCWHPRIPWRFTRLINEICLDEETDSELNNKSHFEYYLKAMKQSWADSFYVEKTLNYIKHHYMKDQELEWLNHFPSPWVEEHFRYMREIANITKEPELLLFKPLASFTLCREWLIPEFFTSIVKNIEPEFWESNEYLIKYLDRHIELDWEEHYIKWNQLLSYFLTFSNVDDALEAVIKSLKLRLKVLSEVNEKILKEQ